MNIQGIQLDSTVWSPNDGSGPTVLGKMYALMVTIREVAKRVFTTLYCRKRDVFSTPGQQLGAVALKTALDPCTKKGDNVLLVEQYFAGGPSTITHQTTLKDLIDRLEFENLKSGNTIILPIVTDNGHFYERNHCSLILVTPNQVEYYDPKGVLSKHFALAGGKTLQDFLNHLRNTYTTKSSMSSILENRQTHQYDCFNCGAYTAYIAQQRLVHKKTFQENEQTRITFDTIQQFRLDCPKNK